MAATFFGEITALDSRAVWYSDEEDEDYEGASSSTRVRSQINVNFQWLHEKPSVNFDQYIVSLTSTTDFKKYRAKTMTHLGNFGTVGKAFHYSVGASNILWLLFDMRSAMLAGQEVCYVVELVLGLVQSEFDYNSSTQMIILSRQYSLKKDLEYLSASAISSEKLPFVGSRMAPPSLIKNQFESSLFEQSILADKPAYIVCLPDPRDFNFSLKDCWPTLSREIFDRRIDDDCLDKTLIYT